MLWHVLYSCGSFVLSICSQNQCPQWVTHKLKTCKLNVYNILKNQYVYALQSNEIPDSTRKRKQLASEAFGTLCL